MIKMEFVVCSGLVGTVFTEPSIFKAPLLKEGEKSPLTRPSLNLLYDFLTKENL